MDTVLKEEVGASLVAFKPVVSQIQRLNIQPHSKRLGPSMGQKYLVVG